MLVELAAKYSVEETDVILAWAQAWTVLNLAPLFSLLDEHALTEPCEVSMKLDERCRVLQRAIIEGVLSVPQIETMPEFASNVTELATLFSQPDKVAPLFSKTVKTGIQVKPYARACQMVDALIDMADFLFSTLTMQRKKELDLAFFLQIGLQLRQQSGIAQLEPVLMQTHVTPLRTHALNALRRAQHRLLEVVLAKMPQTTLEAEQLVQHINAVLTQMGLEVKTDEKTEGEVEPLTLESAVLDVWALSEAASAVGV
jgi:glutamate dehydrogenase